MAWKENLSELKKEEEGSCLRSLLWPRDTSVENREEGSLSLSLSALSFGPLADAVSPQGISIKGPEREGWDARSEQERPHSSIKLE